MNVFLVDDEYWTLQSIKAKIDWSHYGMTVIGEAYNGNDGLREIIEKKPDLVFTDIRMPGMDGLELIEKVRKAGLENQFIIISGHSEFAYAQKALHLGAEGYILKSFDEEEISPVLVAAIKRWKNRKEADASQLMGLVLSRTSEANEEIVRILSRSGLMMNEDTKLCVVIIRSEDKRLTSGAHHTNVVQIRTGKFTSAYVMSVDSLDHFVSQLPNGSKGIGVSKPFTNVNDLADAIQTATEQSCDPFLTGRNGEMLPSANSDASLQELIMKLYEAIRLKNMPEISICLDDIQHKAALRKLTIRDAYRFYNAMMSFVYQYDEDEEPYLHSYEALMEMYPTVEAMLASIKSLIVQKLEWESSSRPDTVDSRETTSKFVNWIKERYYENLTIHHLAEQFSFNPNYVSQLFQKQLQTTFTKYLLQIRLDRACLLLKETELTVSEVAEKVGYSDYFYFAKIFKKSFNLTPTQFRSNHYQ
ncbi:hypothetical protein A8709_13840 [Paenibacillus pectinilyticus]|uniref:DNA-binding response regulator n=1 Tax=Paenibacillus pectinilyticus TaxID=512399 RepID=A0A1C1A3X3_9BACL|nr:response regulator [Paenibacillus pectinilyticus]OCT15180.1 hypothetical protein A8709_13840 [Paenibacillus pectinilyticus]